MTKKPTKFEGVPDEKEVANPFFDEFEIQAALEPARIRLAALPPPALKAIAGNGGLDGFFAAARLAILNKAGDASRLANIIENTEGGPPAIAVQAMARIYGQTLVTCYADLVTTIKGMDLNSRKAFAKKSESYPDGGILLETTGKKVDAILDRASKCLTGQQQVTNEDNNNYDIQSTLH